MNTKHIVRLFASIFSFGIALLCFVYSTIFLIGYIDLEFLHPVPLTSDNVLIQISRYFIPLMYVFGYILGILLLAVGVRLFKEAGSLESIT